MRKPSLKSVKTVARFVTSNSSAFVAGNIIKNNVTVESKLQKAEFLIGCAAIGGVVGSAAGRWSDDLIDEIVETYNQAKQDHS